MIFKAVALVKTCVQVAFYWTLKWFHNKKRGVQESGCDKKIIVQGSMECFPNNLRILIMIIIEC